MHTIVPVHKILGDCALTLHRAINNASESLGQGKPPRDVITVLCHETQLVALSLYREARELEELQDTCDVEQVGQSTSDIEYQRGYREGFDRGTAEAKSWAMEARCCLLECDSELSAQGHHRPPSARDELLQLSAKCRHLSESSPHIASL
jgi:hypothetical protein